MSKRRSAWLLADHYFYFFQVLTAEIVHSHCLPVHFAATDLSQDFTIERNDSGSLWPIHVQNNVESSISKLENPVDL